MSAQDCPASHPVCSEWGYCQDASYKPGEGSLNLEAAPTQGYPIPPALPPLAPAPAPPPKPAAHQGYGPGTLEEEGQKWEDGACSSDADCPSEAPRCSEWGYCQQGGGECSSNLDCTDDNPVCSEWGFCQSASYQQGGGAALQTHL